MGIPAFYRWVIERYPLVVVDVVEQAPAVANGVPLPIDTSRPNPNGVEFDNLYLDMNGIIHPCFHPEGLPAPKTYEEVYKAIFKYIDRIFSLIRPRKLLYMAIDGVAPRAKMNQQRSRRFKAAKNAADEASGTEGLRGVHELEEKKFTVLEQTKKLDSNVITPGTEFMTLLSSALQYYVQSRMNIDPGWQGIKVILSDASVPGEGEHKIMSYIRLQRNLPGFNPNTRHCLYGLDADLIMLALATHEIHFSILREHSQKGYTNNRRPKYGKDSFLMNRQKERGQSEDSEQVADHGKNIEVFIMNQTFQFLDIWVLRDYLALDLKIPRIKTDLEHLIDDFVFMCLFVGNDFLPRVPSLEISEGAIDLLMIVYKKEFVQMGGYLTNSSKVNLKCVEHFVQAVGSHENAIFGRRSQVQKERTIQFQKFPASANVTKIQNSTTHVSDGANSVVDKIKLGEEGWKERYYTEKFEVETDADREKVRRHAVLKYIEGICWVMHYYYQGVCSWQWFYPYHYAPFASDFNGLDKLGIHFTLGQPFKPIDQLMAVLPAASAHALPLFYRQLMTDMSSPISDFYPTDFELDMDGKRFAWQAICKLPFVKESRLLEEIAKVEYTLTDEEKQRNSLGLDVLFVHISHPLAVKIFCFCNRKKDHPKLPMAKVKRKINPEASGGMNGYMYISEKPVCPVEICSPIDDMEMITKNKVVSVFYKCPSFQFHIPIPPKGVIMPQKSISKWHVLPTPVLWHDKTFGRFLHERPVPKSVSGPILATTAHRLVSEYYVSMQQESMGCMKNLNDLACHSSLKPADGARDVNGVAENHINGEPNLKPTECVREVNGVRETHINGEPGLKPTDIVRKVNGAVDDLACQSNLKPTNCARDVNGFGENRIDGEPNLKPTDCVREVNGVGENHIDGEPNLKPTDCVREVNGIGENHIDGEPLKRKPSKKRWARRKNKQMDAQGGPDSRSEVAKSQEGMDCLKSIEIAGVDDLACQTNLKPTYSVMDVNGVSENHIDGDAQGGPDSKIETVKCQEGMGCLKSVENAGVGDLACQTNMKPTDCVRDINGVGENLINGEPIKMTTSIRRKSKQIDAQGVPDSKIETVKCQEGMGYMKSVENAGVGDSACQTNMKPTDCVRDINGVGENLINGEPIKMTTSKRRRVRRKSKQIDAQGGPNSRLEIAKCQEGMKCFKSVENAGVGDLACQKTNLRPTDCVRDVNGVGENRIDGYAPSGPDNKFEAAKHQEGMKCLQSVENAGADILACRLKLGQTDSAREVDGGGENYIDDEARKRKQSEDHGTLDNEVLACQSTLKPRDCERDVNGVGENRIDGEPIKKKPNKKRWASRKSKQIDAQGGPGNKIEAAKYQEGMECLRSVENASVDDLACQSDLRPTDCVKDVDGVGENRIDGYAPGGKIEAAKCQEGMECLRSVENAGVDILACQLKLGQTDSARGVVGGGENYIDGEARKRKRSEDRGALDNEVLACQSNLKPTVCARDVNGVGENRIDGEPIKKKPNKKRRASRKSKQINDQDGPGNKIEAAKYQEGMECLRSVENAGVDDLACQSNLKPTVCVRDVNGVGENWIDGDSPGGPDNKIEAAKCPEGMECLESVESAGADILAWQLKLGRKDSAREVDGGGENYIDGEARKRTQSEDHGALHNKILACQSNLKPTDCVRDVNGVGENHIDGEPIKKKPRKKRRALRKNNPIDVQGGVDIKIEAAKCQEGMECLKSVDNAAVNILACQQKSGQADCAREVDGGGENYIDGEPRKRKRSEDHGALDEEIKKKAELG